MNIILRQIQDIPHLTGKCEQRQNSISSTVQFDVSFLHCGANGAVYEQVANITIHVCAPLLMQVKVNWLSKLFILIFF